MAAVDAVLTVGDRQRSIRATLRNADGTLATLTAVTFRMVDATLPVGGVPKIDYIAAVIEGPGVARYDWQAADVNTAGTYYIWFRDVDASGRAQHWPDGGRVYAIRWAPAG